MDYYLVFLELMVGMALLLWSGYQVFRYIRSGPEERQARKLYFRIGLFILLIGLADFSKAIRELIQLLGGGR